MPHKLIIAALFALAFAPGTAHALKCVPPVLNDESFDEADVIFEGIVKTSQVKNAIVDRRRVKSKIHSFDVTRVWKGDALPDTITVAGDPDWGMDFAPGNPYLVIAERTEEEPGYLIPLCSYTRLTAAAGAGLKFLKDNKTPIQE